MSRALPGHLLAPPTPLDEDPELNGLPPPSPQRVADAIRRGRCPRDRSFDRFLPHDVQAASSMHWTPVAVAMLAAEWLADLHVRTVVDIGSGAGKLCVVAALAGQRSKIRCRFTGLEQRPRLVAAATELARTFEVADQVRFSLGVLGVGPTPVADAYYLYNPFAEHIYGPEEQIDQDAELSDERYLRDIAAAERLLDSAPGGTALLTYNGFGGNVPPSYEEIRVNRELPNVLHLWRKR